MRISDWSSDVCSSDLEVLAPKLAGAVNLDRLSRRWPVGMFVVFGSAAAVWGDRDLPGYAAANAALDGLAHQRRAEGLPATAVAWEIGRASCRERRCQYV